MSLKTPLFLGLIVGALYLFIFQIWPDFQKISVKKAELASAQEMVASIKQKNANMNSLIASLKNGQNESQKTFVLGYIPMEKKEELIFNSLSRIASSEGVSVVLGGAALESPKETAAVVQQETQSSQEALFGSGATLDGMGIPVVVLPSEKKITAKVLVLGKYENVKKFVEKVYVLDMLKNISVIDLASAKDEKGGSTENISANLVADFSYIPGADIKNDYNSPVFEKSSFDFATVNQFMGLLSQKAEVVTVEGVGRVNPFLP